MSTDKIHVAGFWMKAFELSACNLRSTQSSVENLFSELSDSHNLSLIKK